MGGLYIYILTFAFFASFGSISVLYSSFVITTLFSFKPFIVVIGIRGIVDVVVGAVAFAFAFAYKKTYIFS